jgi:hypothetical protein
MSSTPIGTVWSVQTRITQVSLGEDNILRYDYTPGAEETIEDAVQTLDEVKKKTLGKKYPVIAYLGKLKSASAEARAYHAGTESNSVYTAAALLVTSPIAKVIGNFFLALNKPALPAKLVTSEEEALDWLKAYTPAH